ncbi:MAG: outer membrane protein transport protein [Candidatus Latescibacteria bacterium]|nr:outer membrane protein transport protein [Candidatus Latescibacterota bacterium]
MKKVSLLFLIALMVSSTGVYASGLAIPEQGAAAMGMSAAVTARSEDLSAIYYNPAGIDYIGKAELFLGFTPIFPTHKFEGATISKDSNKMSFFPPNVYFAGRVNERVVFGIGLYTPFGLGTDWDSKWTGRYTSTYGEVRSVYLTPAVSVKIHDMVSIGASYSWIWSDAVIKKKIDSGLAIYSATAQQNPAAANPAMIANPEYDSEFSLDGDGGSVAYTVGLMLRPFERMQVGLTYKSKTDLEFEGAAKFTHPSAYNALLSQQMPTFQNGIAELNLPSMVNVGLKYDLTSAWDAEFDLNFVNWSTYNELVIDLENNLPSDKLIQVKDWEDGMVFRIGTSYDMSEITTFRAGFLFDQSPVPDETFDAQLPDNDRIGISVGLGRTVNMGGVPICIDASYMYLKFSDRDKDNFVGYQDVGSFDTVNNVPQPGVKDGVIDATDQAIMNGMVGGEYPVANGTYKSFVNLLSISASYKF